MRTPSVLHRLDLRLHAYPAVRVDGVEAPLKLKRGLALLAHLAELSRKVSRAQLAALLWPDAGPAVGRTRLRRLVHQVQAVCGAELIAGDADALWLDTARVHVDSDVQRVRAAAQALLSGAGVPGLDVLLAPDADGLLDGFGIGSDVFDGWLEPRRAEHRRLLARALERLAQQQAHAGDATLAIEAAQRLIALDPLAEAGHAALIGALARRGDTAGVEAAYFRCAELLRAEFGVPPSPALEAAYAIATGRARQADVVARALPDIRFAQTRDGAVAHVASGRGDVPLVIVPGLLSHIEVAFDEPRVRRCFERLAERYRVVMLDRRGMGLSERVGVEPTIDSAVEDMAAVLDSLGAARAWLFGASLGGTVAVEAAAAMPERVAGLVLYGSNARGSWAPDYPWAMNEEQFERWLVKLRAGWGGATSIEAFAPSAAGDLQVQAWWTRMLRSASSQNGIDAILHAFRDMDVRDKLPTLRMPTLVIQRQGDRIVREGAGRYLAARIAGAELELLPGEDHWWWHGDADAVLRAIERFIDRHG
ncbi:alpha/beta hydrolase [Piscinibacter sp. XHJ-5]|uniref:alpha/beta hydrolase n=1 Tax=Piscinibacter sp. XHJ-5 TaxID=3037797 RepID=UPI002453490A|nr:alpha/beta hydrolase [Piscinibacter sp. XHJ-5]